MVMIADLAARTLFRPADLPAGIFVALAGAPFFCGCLSGSGRNAMGNLCLFQLTS